MFCNFRKSMAVSVMAFILLCGCEARGQTVETVRRADAAGASSFLTDEECDTDSEDGREADNGTAKGAGSSETSSAGGENPQNGQEEDPGGAEGGKTENEGGSPDSETGIPDGKSLPQIYVDVCGAVNMPGVVTVAEGSRVFEAVEKAGGLAGNADGSCINKARILSDGEQIYIPTKEETAERKQEFYVNGSLNGSTGDYGAASTGTAGTDSAGSGQVGAAGGDAGRTAGFDPEGKVNINTADSATLQTLTGIGESRAEAIILYRETNGAFESVEDIMKVTGIKNALFNNIKNDITVG